MILLSTEDHSGRAGEQVEKLPVRVGQVTVSGFEPDQADTGICRQVFPHLPEHGAGEYLVGSEEYDFLILQIRQPADIIHPNLFRFLKEKEQTAGPAADKNGIKIIK